MPLSLLGSPVVFPAQVGMIRQHLRLPHASSCIPRAGGDDPNSGAIAAIQATYSPRRWG